MSDGAAEELTDRQAVVDLVDGLGLWLDEKRFAEGR